MAFSNYVYAVALGDHARTLAIKIKGGLQPLMKQIGILGVQASQHSFRDQKLGFDNWPARYEGMADPFLNLAGTIEDFNSGRATPKPNRFQDRPALIDEGSNGGLLASITYEGIEAGAQWVRWGTNKPYARNHQEGSPPTFIQLKQQGEQKMKEWLYGKGNTKQPKRKMTTKFTRKSVTHYGRNGIDPKQKTPISAYAPKLIPIIRNKGLTQSIARRPFLGVPPEMEEKIQKTIARYFKGIQKKGAS